MPGRRRTRPLVLATTLLALPAMVLATVVALPPTSPAAAGAHLGRPAFRTTLHLPVVAVPGARVPIRATVHPARPGHLVRLQQFRDGEWEIVRRAREDHAGRATFVLRPTRLGDVRVRALAEREASASHEFRVASPTEVVYEDSRTVDVNTEPALSLDGRTVVLRACDPSVVRPNGCDLLRFDRRTGTLSDLTGRAGHQENQEVVSGDGSVVAFSSFATFGTRDADIADDVFTLSDGRFRLLSHVYREPGVTSDAASEPVAVSADGHLVTFWSEAHGLLAHLLPDEGDSHAWLFQSDLRTGALHPISCEISRDADPGHGCSVGGAASVSADGLTFASLVNHPAPHGSGYRLWTRTEGFGARIAPPGHDVYNRFPPTLSADGRYVAVEAVDTTHPRPPDSSGTTIPGRLDVMRLDSRTGRWTDLSTGSLSDTNFLSGMSADGRTVVFDETWDGEPGSPSERTAGTYVWHPGLASPVRVASPCPGLESRVEVSADGSVLALVCGPRVLTEMLRPLTW